MGGAVSDFKGRHFQGEIVLWAVRWCCCYGVSHRDLEQMTGERGISFDHATIYRWVQRYAPEIERRLRLLVLPHRLIATEPSGELRTGVSTKSPCALLGRTDP